LRTAYLKIHGQCQRLSQKQIVTALTRPAVARLHTRTSEAPAALDNILPALHKASRHKNARGSGGMAPRILKVMQLDYISGL
jgi:hypothetical protein